MKNLGLLAIVTFALSFTAAAPLERREPNTNAPVQRDTDTSILFLRPSWENKREVDTAEALEFRWIEKREVKKRA
ncbi:hypothetical protein M422DRAFT_269060 [Sphaerobolus stellatus SS14]|uniref:Uncharacterized protein n=1 Tax=Sphaerobolus stellatus (strain SS14) TaxID=990650 RepID=A0A0C9U5H7_SPHS4|nr:hypothetical protein M422DRAFT_269060 [Sphaerobolus stellatus SS14]